MQIGSTVVSVVRGSVLDQDVEAIVNAANTGMRGGGGIDGAIHAAAGPELMQELRRVVPHSCPRGEAVITHGHRLKQPWIIHTPGPVWNGGDQNEDSLLASSYRRCLEVAEEHGLHSIAFCSISTGAYRFPLDRAAGIAVKTVQQYLQAHPETSLRRIVFAMYRSEEYEVFHHALETITQAENPTVEASSAAALLRPSQDSQETDPQTLLRANTSEETGIEDL